MADVATLVFDIDSSQARGAAKALAEMTRGAAATDTMTAKLETTYRRANGQFATFGEYINKNESAIRRLAASYNPVLSAQLRFSDAQKEVARAVQLGVISTDRQAELLRELQVQYASTASTSGTFAKQQTIAAMQTGNVFAQLNDIGVMLAAGQNPIQLALQQGTQLNQVWASMGAQGRTLGGVAGMLRGAFASMISPMSLLTLGVIAGAGALVQWATAADDASAEAVTLEEQYTNLASAASTYITAIENVLTPLSNLNERFGAQAEQMRAIYEMQGRLARIEFVGKMQEANAALQEQFRGLTESVARLEQAMSLPDYLHEEKVQILREEMQRLQVEFGIGSADARIFAQELAALGAVQGPEAAAAALEKVVDRIITAKDRGGEVPPELIRVAIEAANAAGRATELAAALQAAGVAADNIKLPTSMGATYGNLDWMYGKSIEDIMPNKPESVGGGRRGGGGGGRALEQAKKQFQSLRELIEEDTLFQFAEYEKRQTQLDNALSRKLLSEQNYNMIRSQLQTLYFGTEYEKQQLQFTMEQEQLDLALSQKLISEQRYAEEVSRIKAAQQNAELSGYQTFFGNMASAAKAGGDKTSAAVKAFSVAQGILNSYLAYTQVLADPSLIGRPFLRTALAASTLAAGLGAVASMKSGGGSSSASTATAAAKQEPTRTTLVKLEGDEWLVNLADSLITQIQDASKDGRMIVMRDY